MEVTVDYFGIIGDMVGTRKETVTLPEGATVDDLIKELTSSRDAFGDIAAQVQLVRHGKRAGMDDVLTDGDQIAVMRPIGGGSRDLP